MVTINVPYQRLQCFELKNLLGGTLCLREHNVQISVIYTMIKALHKLTGSSMLKIKVIV
ncbi:hypothetical protein [Candidatus Enterovibrio altilux]|uniref:hypothetical protein n=1 Tax=Candidatus Enterovibrio altilux TaxID=1927128 RepID=UPI003742B1E2